MGELAGAGLRLSWKTRVRVWRKPGPHAGMGRGCKRNRGSQELWGAQKPSLWLVEKRVPRAGLGLSGAGEELPRDLGWETPFPEMGKRGFELRRTTPGELLE